TSPQQNAGQITFYAASVAGDADGSPRGDKVYSTTSSTRLFEPKPPTLNFLTPTHGPIEGNTVVTLRGENFRDGLKVLFDGVDAKGRLVDSTTVLTTTPPHGAGAVDIRIESSDGMG